MNYAEFDVPSSLRRHVQCLWRLRDVPSGQLQTVYPDGRCELIVHIGEPMRLYTVEHGWQSQARCLFSGQLRAAIRLAAVGLVDCIGVRLQPAASSTIVSQHLPALADRIVDLVQLDADFASRLAVECAALGTGSDPGPLYGLLESRIGSLPIDSRIESTVAALDTAHGEISTAALSRLQAISLRSLQIRFLNSVGLTVKEYARVQRLQATIRHLDRDTQSLSQLAADAGFADQAHATREMRRLTGLTPARLRRALQAEREGDETLRMAAAFVRGQMRSIGT